MGYLEEAKTNLNKEAFPYIRNCLTLFLSRDTFPLGHERKISNAYLGAAAGWVRLAEGGLLAAMHTWERRQAWFAWLKEGCWQQCIPGSGGRLGSPG